MSIEKGTVVATVPCCVCGGDVELVAGARPGDLLKGRCYGKLPNKKACLTWMTAGANASSLLKGQFINENTSQTENENHGNPETIEQQDETAACGTGHAGTADAGTDTGRKRRTLFKR